MQMGDQWGNISKRTNDKYLTYLILELMWKQDDSMSGRTVYKHCIFKVARMKKE